MKDRVARSCQESESESVSTMNKSQRLTSVSFVILIYFINNNSLVLVLLLAVLFAAAMEPHMNLSWKSPFFATFAPHFGLKRNCKFYCLVCEMS